jgi:UDP-N-acetyl-D-galactosamine dehydrogenase
MNLNDLRLSVIGLGYVGLPLAVEFGRRRQVIGYDINKTRIEELCQGNDMTLETSTEDLLSAEYLKYTCDLSELKSCNCFIVTVPTPIDNHKQPEIGRAHV